MDSRELQEWLVFYNLYPFGDAREDWRMGQVCATLVNLQVPSSDQMDPGDFMLKPPRDAEDDEAKEPTEIERIRDTIELERVKYLFGQKERPADFSAGQPAAGSS